MDGRALSDLRQLAGRDAELAERADELRRLEEDVAAIRAAAEQIDAFLERLPEEERLRGAELAEAESDLAARRKQLAAADHDVERAGDDDARDHAEHARARAADHVAVAQARVDRAAAAVGDLQRDAQRLPAQLPALVARAREIRQTPPPRHESELVEWASHAHAELFVAARQIDAQRERTIREANELASMLVGEATYGATAAQALARAEAHWVSSPGHVSESR